MKYNYFTIIEEYFILRMHSIPCPFLFHEYIGHGVKERIFLCIQAVYGILYAVKHGISYAVKQQPKEELL